MSESGPSLVIVGDCEVRLWGRTARERIARQFRRVGVSQASDTGPESGVVVLVGADMVLDAPLVAALARTPNIVLTREGHAVAAHVAASDAARIETLILEKAPPEHLPDGVHAVSVDDLDTEYWHALRKRETPYLLELTKENKSEVEWRSYMGTYKGVTDVVTKYVWPVPAFWVTRLCSVLRLTPNMVTAVGLVLTVWTYFLFLDAAWTAGLLAAWAMCFLDTVDGKLARVTLTSSKFGNVFDHGIDLIHPPFWYAAWGLGLAKTATPLDEPTLVWALVAIIGGYVAQRIIEGVFIYFFKIEQHVWRRVDSWFRLITARRNPNLILLSLSALAGRPDLGLLSVAVWTLASLLFHCIRLGQAVAVKLRSGALESWLAAPAKS